MRSSLLTNRRGPCPLSAPRYSALNTFIRAIDSAGALAKLSRLYVFADPEPITSEGGLNIVSLATAKPIPGSSPTFEPNPGYTGNGAATGAISLRTSWTDSKYLQDDAAVGVWCNRDSKSGLIDQAPPLFAHGKPRRDFQRSIMIKRFQWRFSSGPSYSTTTAAICDTASMTTGLEIFRCEVERRRAFPDWEDNLDQLPPFD